MFLNNWPTVAENLYYKGHFSQREVLKKNMVYFARREQLVRQSVDWIFGDINLVPYYLWWRQIVLKCEKVYKRFFQETVWIFRLVFTSLKMQGNSKKTQILVEKDKASS